MLLVALLERLLVLLIREHRIAGHTMRRFCKRLLMLLRCEFFFVLAIEMARDEFVRARLLLEPCFFFDADERVRDLHLPIGFLRLRGNFRHGDLGLGV